MNDDLPLTKVSDLIAKNLSRFIVVIVVGFALYAASYAPFLRYKFGADPSPPESSGFVCCLFDDSYSVRSHAAYRPIETIIDRTPCKVAFQKWCELWGVQFRFELGHRFRESERISAQLSP